MNGTGYRALLCAAAMAAVLLAGCRKSEKPSGPAAAGTPQHPPFGYIDTPKESETVASGSRAYGWALDDSGVKSVTASLDGGPAVAAELGQNSPVVKQAYPTFPNSDKAGFVFEMPSVAAGPHVLAVTVEGKDGGKTDLKRHVQIK